MESCLLNQRQRESFENGADSLRTLIVSAELLRKIGS